MLGITRRRVLSGIAASVISGALVLTLAPPASATPVVVAPLIPEVASTVAEGVAAGCAATGPGCAIVGLAALTYGAWWAYTNRDQLLHWTDSTLGQPQTSTGSPGGGGVWVVSYPPASSGPYTRVSGESFFVAQCQNAACYGGFHAMTKCQASDGTVVTYNWTDSDYMVNPGIQSATLDSSWCTSPSKVVEQTVTYGSSGGYLFWHASGGWDTTRTTTTTTTCKTPGGSSTTVTATSTAVVTSARTSTVPGCPAGTYVTKIEVKDGTGGQADYPRIDWQTNSGIESTYPNCFTGSSPGLGMCALAVTWAGTACDTTVSQCVDWYNQSAFSSTGYGCLWGPYTVPLADCEMLRYSYEPGTTLDPATGLPTNPAASPSPSSSSSGGTFPTTGPNPLPSPSASASGWVQPHPFPTPTGTATPVPEPPPVIGPTPGGSNCMDAAWGWNPVNWVVVPVECALTWAFVPDQAVVQQTKTEMSDAWTNSGTGTFVTGAWSMLAPLGDLSAGDSGACGITVAFPYATGESTTLHLLDACTAPMSTYAPWVKGFLTAMVLFEGVYAVMRALGLGFGISMPGRGRGTVE